MMSVEYLNFIFSIMTLLLAIKLGQVVTSIKWCIAYLPRFSYLPSLCDVMEDAASRYNALISNADNLSAIIRTGRKTSYAKMTTCAAYGCNFE